MGMINIVKQITPGNIQLVNGLLNEFAVNPELMKLLEKFKGLNSAEAYGELVTLSDVELRSVAQAIGRINATAKGVSA